MRILFLLFCFFFWGNHLSAQIWTETQKIVASDRDEEDIFGSATAIDSNIFIIGAPHESHDTLGKNTQTQAGAAYIFEQNPQGEWSQIQKLIASDRSFASYFGWAVDLEGDYAVIGAPGESTNVLGKDTIIGAGAAFIFKRDENDNWVQVQKIVASDRDFRDAFGTSVALDNDFLIVGAIGETILNSGQNLFIHTGAAYIFEKDNTDTWVEVKKLIPSDRVRYDNFGHSVATSGNYAVVGAYSKSDYSGGLPVHGTGVVYVFERGNFGDWVEIQRIVALDNRTADYFGYSLDIDGSTMLIGAMGVKPPNDRNLIGYTGAAYFFERNRLGKWEETQKVYGSDTGPLSLFGWSVSLDGNLAAIGARGDNNILIWVGSAFIFEKKTDGQWYEVQKLTPTDYDYWDYFGVSVSISGTSVVIGANREDEDAFGGNTLDLAGSAYIFERWAPVSISETTSPFPANVYPNPTTGRLIIEMDQVYPEGQIRLYNANGQMILQKDMGQLRETEIQINGPAGIYALVIQTSPEENKTVKVVKISRD